MIGKAVFRAWLLLVSVFGTAGAANAQNFDFSYTSSGISVMGTFVTTSQGNGLYLIDSILNGTRGGNTITLLAPGTFGSNDNILSYPANPYFDSNGFSYSSGGVFYNTYFSGVYVEGSTSGSALLSNVTVGPAGAPAPVPGGGLLSFLALGLAGLVWRGRAIMDRCRSYLAPSHRPAAG